MKIRESKDIIKNKISMYSITLIITNNDNML